MRRALMVPGDYRDPEAVVVRPEDSDHRDTMERVEVDLRKNLEIGGILEFALFSFIITPNYYGSVRGVTYERRKRKK